MKRTEIVRRSGYSEAYISRIAKTIPGAFRNGKQWEFDGDDPKLQRWLADAHAQNADRSARAHAGVGPVRRQSSNRSMTDGVTALGEFADAFERCRPFRQKLRFEEKGVEIDSGLSLDEWMELVALLKAWRRIPSRDAVYAILCYYRHHPPPAEVSRFFAAYAGMFCPNDPDHAGTEILSQARPAHILPSEPIAPEQIAELLNHISHFHWLHLFIAADVFRYADLQFGAHQKEEKLAEVGFFLWEFKKATEIGSSPTEWRNRKLLPDHFCAVATIPDDKKGLVQRRKWLAIAIKEKLTPLELRRSISKGKVEHSEDTPAGRGRNSGIPTIEAVRTFFDRWMRKGGGQILECDLQTQREFLEEVRPMLDLFVAVRQKIEASKPRRRDGAARARVITDPLNSSRPDPVSRWDSSGG